METFKAHYKANGLQRDIPDIKAASPTAHLSPTLTPPSLSLCVSLSPESKIGGACVKLMCHPQNFCYETAVGGGKKKKPPTKRHILIK